MASKSEELSPAVLGKLRELQEASEAKLIAAVSAAIATAFAMNSNAIKAAEEKAAAAERRAAAAEARAKARELAGTTRLYVKDLVGHVVELHLKQADTIDAVKDAVARRLGVPQDQQRLIFDGRQLEDDRTLADYGIGQDSTIHMVLKLRGD